MIHQGNCIEVLQTYPDESFDLAFADPPYNYQSKTKLVRPEGGNYVGIAKEEWDKFSTFEEFDTFTISWLSQVKRVLKKKGSLWISGSYQSIYRVGYHLQNLGFWIMNEIIWEKPNPTPNFTGTRFCAAHENLIWCAKSKKDHPYFNYKLLKKENGNRQLKSVWNLPSPQKIKENDSQVNVAQKPEELLYLILRATSKEGDRVLDPFCGTGTTGVMCEKLGRQFVGIEIDKKQAKLASQRIGLTDKLLF